jgi:hypothetical protein
VSLMSIKFEGEPPFYLGVAETAAAQELDTNVIVRMMTSFAFILGLLPLVIATGAAQLARRDVGTPVFGGMILASFIGIFAIPSLYVTFQAIREKLRPAARPKLEQMKPLS